MRSIVGEDTPIKITHPYIQPELYQQLGSLSYNVDSKMVTTVGRGSRYKGVDLLVEAWAEVYKNTPNINYKLSVKAIHLVMKTPPESLYVDSSMISRKCMRIRASMYNLQDMMHSELLFLKHYEWEFLRL